jgi:hypothetical protein
MIEYFGSYSPHLLVMPPITEEALPSTTAHPFVRPPLAGEISTLGNKLLEAPWLLDGDFASLSSTRHLISSHRQSEPGDVNAVSGINKLDNKLQALWLFLDFYGIPFAALTVCLRLDDVCNVNTINKKRQFETSKKFSLLKSKVIYVLIHFTFFKVIYYFLKKGCNVTYS